MPAGRPTLLTTETTEKIVALLRTGTPLSTTLTAAGVSRRSYQRWTACTDPAARAFREAVERARAEAEVMDVALIAQAADRDWPAAAALLERQWPERWAEHPRAPRVSAYADPAEPSVED